VPVLIIFSAASDLPPRHGECDVFFPRRLRAPVLILFFVPLDGCYNFRFPSSKLGFLTCQGPPGSSPRIGTTSFISCRFFFLPASPSIPIPSFGEEMNLSGGSWPLPLLERLALSKFDFSWVLFGHSPLVESFFFFITERSIVWLLLSPAGRGRVLSRIGLQ